MGLIKLDIIDFTYKQSYVNRTTENTVKTKLKKQLNCKLILIYSNQDVKYFYHLKVSQYFSIA